MREGVLNQTVFLVEGESTNETAVFIQHGTTVEILREVLAPTYKTGIAFVIFDGKEAVTVDSSMVDELY